METIDRVTFLDYNPLAREIIELLMTKGKSELQIPHSRLAHSLVVDGFLFQEIGKDLKVRFEVTPLGKEAFELLKEYKKNKETAT